VEYGVVVALVAAAGLSAVGQLGGDLSQLFMDAAIKVEEVSIDPDAFALEISADAFTLYPMVGGAIEVDWGNDAANETCGQSFTAGAPVSCVYPSFDTYLVAVTGNMTAYGDEAGASTNDAITRIVQWGNTGLYWLENAFDGARNLVDVPDHLPPGTGSLAAAFRNASSLNDPDIANWDTSNVTSFSYTFSGASRLNVDISSWDTSSAINMHAMFSDASRFNADIGGWDVRDVYTMEGMFRRATSFNQDLDNWDVSSVSLFEGMFKDGNFNGSLSSWNTSSATDMRNMFLRNPSFNQDISGWDVSSVSMFTSMFEEATAFSHDLSGWDVGGATEMTQMFRFAANFTSDLSSWCVSAIPSRPSAFSSGSGMAVEPIWGTCP